MVLRAMHSACVHEVQVRTTYVMIVIKCSCITVHWNMEEDSTLSHRAEVFRSKLIEDFQILECTSEEGRRKAPVYTSADIISQSWQLC